MQSDPRIMRLNLKKLKEGINIKTTSLKSVKKKLKQVTRNNEMKQKELEELKKRYSETLLKLQIGTEEAQLLSKEVKDLKGTAGDATVESRGLGRCIDTYCKSTSHASFSSNFIYNKD